MSAATPVTYTTFRHCAATTGLPVAGAVIALTVLAAATFAAMTAYQIAPTTLLVPLMGAVVLSTGIPAHFLIAGAILFAGCLAALLIAAAVSRARYAAVQLSQTPVCY